MATEIEIHPIQAKIINILVFRPEAKFSELNSDHLPTDQFSFHLKRLLASGVVEKNGNKYKLTNVGKEFANRFDTEKVVIERQAKISVLIRAEKKEGKVTKYLIQHRLKHPNYGFYALVGGKVRWGEGVIDAAKRELLEETGLAGKITLRGIEHKTDFGEDGSILEEKFLFFCRATDVSGKFIPKFEGGENLWLSKAELAKLPKEYLHGDHKLAQKLLGSKNLSFAEAKYVVKNY